MPAGAKLVIGSLLGLVVLNIMSLLVQTAPSLPAAVAIIIQIALLVGLFDRRPFAWHAARWLTALAIASDAVALVMAAPLAVVARYSLLTSVLVNLALAIGLFCLLGRADSRDYFNAPQKV